MIKTLYYKLKRRLSKDWHRAGVGGMWDQIGQLQFEFLVDRGLLPEHFFLDIGCGSLRAGVHFIKYLRNGHYYGIEKEKSLLQAGLDIEMKRYGLEHKSVNLLLVDDFDLSGIRKEIEFDFMLAQSVFTHLTPEVISTCLMRVLPRLKETGTFYATFNESENSEINNGRPHPWRKSERSQTNYPFALFQQLAEKADCYVDYIGNWGHPRNQKMLAFRRSRKG